ncbi:MAG: thioredoxin domain-containing protein, partial [Asgard group archaeon]|nr:thioredoxin domain-containing protein [Asgard group archaeon]
LAKAGRIFGEEKYIALAKKASEFLMKNLFKNNQLYHRYRKGETGIKGLLDDYTFLIWGLLELYESTFDYYYLKIALQIQEIQDKKFLDDEPKKGYYLTPEDGEKLLLREKTIHDGALPSGNSIAIYNLIRLSRITANQNQEQLAEKIIQSFSERIKEALSAHTMVFVSLEYLYGTSYEFVFVGSKRDPELEKLIKKLREEYLPNKIVLYLPLNSNSREEIFKLTEFVKYKKQINEKATVYVCKNKFCKKPVNTPNQMLKQIHN